MQMRIVSAAIFHKWMKLCAFETRERQKKNEIIGKETFDTEFQTGFNEFHGSIVQCILNDSFVFFDENRTSRIDDITT